jgi:hypothetical protein
MKKWSRKLRAIRGIGAIWSLVGSVLGFSLSAFVSIFWHDVLPTTVVDYVAFTTLQHAVIGFVLGSGFAGVLTILEGRKTLDELTPGRAALWGALTGVGFATALGLFLTSGLGVSITLALWVAMPGVYGAVTAGIAAGTVSLARRAPAELEAGTPVNDSKVLGGAHQFGTIWAQTKRDELGGSG